MSRTALNKLPEPSPLHQMRVVGLGASRTGTLGVFLALKMLGYRPFHISELLPHGVRQMQALEEAMVASSTDTPYTRAELDKLFGDYDCLIESPCYLGASGIQTYVDDPNIKFILTQRSPESFAKSLSGSLGCYYAKLHEWPLTAARVCDGFVWELERMFRLMTFRWSHGLHPSDPDFRSALEQSYLEYMKTVRSLVPAERVLVLDLDKGFGWEEICNFLECEVPEEPYPRSNSMAEFHVAAEMVLAPAVRKTMVLLATSTAALVGFGAWYLQRLRK
ncbi:P-loop containing nucleoside triphosphate hydrolase protein [Apiospora kogelbergensis]|uniref:P-loop containing nucleoside triphosphate hydrolase protein n=1 Tax=Apiospora kogelbergensis TaxID=1337665 RepID=A0AAW0R028_9PEZI